jgi:hypothetical protein
MPLKSCNNGQLSVLVRDVNALTNSLYEIVKMLSTSAVQMSSDKLPSPNFRRFQLSQKTRPHRRGSSFKTVQYIISFE